MIAKILFADDDAKNCAVEFWKPVVCDCRAIDFQVTEHEIFLLGLVILFDVDIRV